jgi:hypothetical protein
MENLNTIAPWIEKAELPESYFPTKNKNPEKQRPVVTAWNHPEKTAFKICEK